MSTCLHGAALAGMDQAEEGLAQLRLGMQLYQGLKTPPIFWPLLLFIQAGVCGQVGKPEEGLALLDEAMGIASHWSGRTMQPEFFRLKGDLLVGATPENMSEAEGWLRQAVEIAQEVGARMMELRAATSLSRLWREQGKAGQGKRLLSKAYESFTEGFTTADMIVAKNLLR